MANAPAKFRLPKIQTPWEPVANRELEIVLENLNDALRDLEEDKLEGADFNVSGSTHGDILVADENLVYRPAKVVPFTFGVGTNLSVTGTLTVTGNVSLGGTLSVTGDVTLHARLIVSGDPAASATLPKLQIGNPLVGGNTSGTVYGANLSAAFLGDLIHLQTNDAKRFSVDASGHVLLGGGQTQCKVNFGVANNTRPALISAGAGLEVRLGDFSNYAELYCSNLYANGTLGAIGAAAMFAVYRRDNGNNAWSIYSAAGDFSIYDLVGGADRVTLTTQTGALTLGLADTATNTVTIGVTLRHNSSNTPAAGFGNEIRFQLKSSTTENRNAAGIRVGWVTATEGSQAASGAIDAYYTSTSRECVAWAADSVGPKFSVFGVATAYQQTGGAQTAGATWTATEQDMLQKAYDALRTFGYLD